MIVRVLGPAHASALLHIARCCFYCYIGGELFAVNTMRFGFNQIIGKSGLIQSKLASVTMESFELNQSSGDETGSKASTVITDTNTVGSTTGLVNATARDFNNANSEYFESTAANASAIHPGTGDFSFEVWFRYEHYGTTGTRYILGIGNPQGVTGDEGFSCRIFDTGSAFNMTSMIRSTSAHIESTTGVVFSYNTWYQVIVTFDRDGNVTTYVNGTSSKTDSIASLSAANISPTTFPLRVGAYNYGTANQFWDGQIGPLRFFNVSLDSDQVAYLYNGGSGRQYPV